MSLDLTGAQLAQLIVTALNIPTPPVNPTQAQAQNYVDAVQAQLDTWTIICNQFLTYIHQNAQLTIPATGIKDSANANCTGTSTTGTIS